MSKRIIGHTYWSYDIEKVKNRTDKSLLVISNTESCPELFQDDVAFFDQVTELDIHCDSSASKKDCKDIVKFHNLEYLSVYALTLEMSTWIELFKNCLNLKELHLYSGSGCWFYFTKEAFSEIFKLPNLEVLEIRKLSLPFWPEGPSNIRYLELFVIGDDDDLKTTDYKNNFHTHTNLKEVNITINDKYTPFLISTLNLDKCLNLETITIETNEDNLHESIHKILQLPKLKKITFNKCQMEYFVTDNSLIFPNVEEIIIGDLDIYSTNEKKYFKKCFKYIEDEINGEWHNHKKVIKCYNYPLQENVEKMLKQCPNLKICLLNDQNLN
jgi:hypothetical protein